MNRLKNKVALITGATRGLGRAMATMFGEEGAKVAVTGRTEADGLKVVKTIRDAGGTAEFIRFDMADEQSVKTAMKNVVLTPKIGDPKDLAYAATFLASDESAYITGQLIPVDGGIASYMPIPKVEPAKT